ncbi:sperm-associated antigen 6-like [Anthonomus grandis grandis]|uniref:sperm-associated antigen 6-like n=1 Tax=Anthonomus grandis grandis TaxID=2921223 RepID=UPI0021660F26|nr:sperm-associated antigen 6-like [Anthonomus grandis grandis]
MTSRTILQVFENYQKSRLVFAQTVSDLASRQQNVELMKSAHVLDLLKPLIIDVCPQIKQCASIALGRLVHHDPQIAEELMDVGVLGILLHNAGTGNKFQKTAVLFVVRSICKHSEKMAEMVIKNGGLQTLIFCLEDFEPAVKESAAWGIGYIARHSKKLAQECVNGGVLPLLMLCLQEPELSLKQIATSAITDIAKHGEDLATAVVDAGIVAYLAKNLHNSDEKLKRQCLAALSSVAKHSPELAEVVVEAEVFPSVSQHLSHPCAAIRRNAACLIRDVAKQSLELTQLIVNTGGVGALLEVLFSYPSKEVESSNDARIPCVSAIGFIAGQSSQLAMTVLGCRTIQVLARILSESSNDDLLTVTVWTIGRIGRHSPEHSSAVASANIFPRLVQLYESPDSSLDLKNKIHATLKECLQNCLVISALEPLLATAPPDILKYVLGQYSKVLPNDPKARRLFVTSGGLKKVQLIEAKPGSTLMEYITVINSCFPEEIVRFYSPGYPDTLLDRVEQYAPQLMTVLRETGQTSEEMQTEIVKSVARDDMSSESGSTQATDVAEK